jgi:hypothetical protein
VLLGDGVDRLGRQLGVHPGQEGARADAVDPERTLPVLGVQVVDPAAARQHARVADQHVEPAEAVDGVLDDRLDLPEAGHVGRHGVHLAGGLLEAGLDLVQGFLAEVAEHQVGVRLGGQLAGERGAERAAGSQNDDYAARAVHVFPCVAV